MRTLVLIGALVVVALASRELVTKEMVDYINSAQNDWVASTETSMAHVTEDEAHFLFGGHKARKQGAKSFPKKTFSVDEINALPTEFDSRDAWPNCDSIKQVRDQSHCGS